MKKVIILALAALTFVLLSCNAERRINDSSYTDCWYNIDTLRFQVYKTQSGRNYIIILNESETKFVRQYLSKDAKLDCK